MTKAQKNGVRTVIVTTQYRDLYYGEISATDAEIARDHAVSVVACRHIGYWKGPKGGLTSLAVEGPGPGSNIGHSLDAPALITGVAHILPVTEEARARFAAYKS
jgi:hypothetical protein